MKKHFKKHNQTFTFAIDSSCLATSTQSKIKNHKLTNRQFIKNMSPSSSFHQGSIFDKTSSQISHNLALSKIKDETCFDLKSDSKENNEQSSIRKLTLDNKQKVKQVLRTQQNQPIRKNREKQKINQINLNTLSHKNPVSSSRSTRSRRSNLKAKYLFNFSITESNQNYSSRSLKKNNNDNSMLMNRSLKFSDLNLTVINQKHDFKYDQLRKNQKSQSQIIQFNDGKVSLSNFHPQSSSSSFNLNLTKDSNFQQTSQSIVFANSASNPTKPIKKCSINGSNDKFSEILIRMKQLKKLHSQKKYKLKKCAHNNYRLNTTESQWNEITKIVQQAQKRYQQNSNKQQKNIIQSPAMEGLSNIPQEKQIQLKYQIDPHNDKDGLQPDQLQLIAGKQKKFGEKILQNNDLKILTKQSAILITKETKQVSKQELPIQKQRDQMLKNSKTKRKIQFQEIQLKQQISQQTKQSVQSHSPQPKIAKNPPKKSISQRGSLFGNKNDIRAAIANINSINILDQKKTMKLINLIYEQIIYPMSICLKQATYLVNQYIIPHGNSAIYLFYRQIYLLCRIIQLIIQQILQQRSIVSSQCSIITEACKQSQKSIASIVASNNNTNNSQSSQYMRLIDKYNKLQRQNRKCLSQIKIMKAELVDDIKKGNKSQGSRLSRHQLIELPLDYQTVEDLEKQLKYEQQQFIKTNVKVLKKLLGKISKNKQTKTPQFHIFLNYGASFVNITHSHNIIKKIVQPEFLTQKQSQQLKVLRLSLQDVGLDILSLLYKKFKFIQAKYISIKPKLFELYIEIPQQNKQIEEHYISIVKKIKQIEVQFRNTQKEKQHMLLNK